MGLNGEKEEKGEGKQGKGGVRKMEKKSVDFCNGESRGGRLQIEEKNTKQTGSLSKESLTL